MMGVALVLQLALAQPPSPSLRASIMAVIAANAADLVSTKLALNSGACEQNPLMARLPFPTVVAAKSASVTLVILSQTQLRKHGHPRLARAIGYIDASAVGAVALSNLRYVR